MSDAARDRLAALESEVESLRAAVHTLHRVSNLLREPLEVEAVLYAILTGVTAGVGLGFNRAVLFVEEGDALFVRAAVGPLDADEADRVWRSIEGEALGLIDLYQAGLAHRDTPSSLDRKLRGVRVARDGATLPAIALRERRLVRAEGEDTLEGLLHLATGVAVPIRGRAHRGVLYADNRFTGRAVDETGAQIFALVAEQAERALSRASIYEHLEREARTDALTGLPHRRALDRALAAACLAAAGDGRPVGLAMIDLDDFKAVNDSRGHAVGDAVLVGFAERAGGVLRSGEQLFRYGGEEFVLVLPGADGAAVAAVAERVRAAVAERRFAEGLRLTCSVGAAAASGPELEPSRLLERADRALLDAKATGKNRVVLAAEAGAQA